MSAAGERCEVCEADLTGGAPRRTRSGRPARYCSSACRQRAYRLRLTVGAPVPAATVHPPARSLGPSWLPAPLDSFVGRDAELAALGELLDRYRLVTLLGPGGAGKTRLAVELATRVRGRYPDGVWLVELASVTEPGLLAQAVADCLHVPEQIGCPVLSTVADALSGKRALLVLDNCEQVVGSAAQLVQTLLRCCPRLQAVTTSRESLDVPGEAVFRVRELSLPARHARSDPERLLASDAVRLFLDRATAGAADVVLTRDNAAHVAAICTRLDGMPLAIELAAKRARVLPVAEIHARLDDRFRLLTGGARTAARRHRDLRATIEWSHDLLDGVEQVVFRRLSVLVGGFGLATATAVCADGTTVPAEAMLDLLSGLEARSLVTDERAGRFRQLESIRLYGRDRLHVAGEEDLAFDRLTGYLVGLAEPVVGDGMLHCYEELQPLDLERANLAAATEWATRRGDPRHVHLATALGRCWRHHGYISDGRTLLRTALDGAPADHPGRSAALVQAAWLATTGGDHAEALRLAGEAVRLDERSGGTARLARALDMLTWVQLCAGQDADADRTSQRALRLVPELERPLDAAVCLHNHAYYLLQAGHLTQAGELMRRCLPLYREHSPYPLPAEWLHSAGMLALTGGEVDAAEGHFREALRRYLPAGDTDDLPVGTVDLLEALAVVAARRGDGVRALRLDAVVEAVHRSRHLSAEPAARRLRDEALAVARAGLAPDAARVAQAQGARLSLAAAVRYAVDDTWPDEPAVLTEPETALAHLVAAGLSNREIAARLHVAERTVEAALRGLRTKLHLRSRAQLAAWSTENLP